MTLRHWHTAISAVALAIVCALHTTAQTQAPAAESLRFEVASLKPSQPDAQGPSIIRPTPGNQGYLGTNMPLRAYLMIAYVVRDSQIAGAPSWFANDRYDLNAKAQIVPQLAAAREIPGDRVQAARRGLRQARRARPA